MEVTAEFDQLMAAVRAGSEDAIWQLAETYTPYIIRAARVSLDRGVRSKLDSQDLVQTLWKSLLLKRADLSRLKTPEELVAFLVRATKNKAIDKMRHFRTQGRDIRRETQLQNCGTAPNDAVVHRKRNELQARDPSPSSIAMVRERWKQIVSTASARDRQIYELRRNGAEFKTISIQLRIDESTARRVIQRLIEQLSD
jgi:RNA polymerase sigma-70 factor (ECF subfamily)